MKPIFSFCSFLLLLSFSFIQAQQAPREWEDLEVVSRNTVAPHATFHVFDSEEEAKQGNYESSGNYQSLNGTWKFHFSETPDGRPKTFYQTKYNTDSWDDIEVPGDWQLQGYDFPLYTNIAYPFPKNPPYVDNSYNPIGSYKRSFEVPSEWNGEEVYLHFGGVNSAFYVWVNGEEVGYKEGAKTPAEFNITPFLKEGKN
ncbi:MAG: sugar-binding domain-containing protein, partial [Salegentibacter sp.]